MSDALQAADQPGNRQHQDVSADLLEELSQLAGKSDADFLVAAAHAIHSTLYLNELYKVVLYILQHATEADAAVLLIQRPRTHHPIIFKVLRVSETNVRDLPMAVGRRFLEHLAEVSNAIHTFAETPAEMRRTLDDAVGHPVSECRWVPLAPQGRFLGVIGIIPGDNGFGARAEALLNPLVEQAAVALDNAILYRRAEREFLQNQLLLEASHLLMSSLNLDEILDNIMDALQRAVPYNAVGIFLVGDNGDVERIVDRGYNPQSRPSLDRKAGVGLVGWVASTGKPLIIDNVREDPRYQAARETTQSEMVVPIFAGDNLVGVFNLERDIAGGFYEPDLNLVRALAQHAGVAIERARLHEAEMERRRMKGELEVARSIQKSFLPHRNPKINGYDIAGVNISSEEVGGDYYDFISIVEGQVGIAIADSSGKGIPAALIMAAFRASLIAEIRNNYSLHVVMQKVNQLLCEGNEKTRFVTAVYGVLDARSRVFTFSNAGHNPGILRHANGDTMLLDALGTALGIFRDARYEERVIGLHPGDVLLLYTDGVPDVVGKDGEMFDLDRLIELVHKHAKLPAAAILENVRRDVMEFADPLAPVDDFTMVAVKVL